MGRANEELEASSGGGGQHSIVRSIFNVRRPGGSGSAKKNRPRPHSRDTRHRPAVGPPLIDSTPGKAYQERDIDAEIAKATATAPTPPPPPNPKDDVSHYHILSLDLERTWVITGRKAE